MLVSAKLPKYGSRSEVPTAVCRITNGTNATYVRPSENTSGRVPGGNRCATRCGSTGQCTNVRSAQNWSNSTGRGSGGAITGKLTAPSWHAERMSSPTIWSAGRYESVGERIAPIAAVVDARPMGDPETITARLSDGFVDVTIENDTHTWEFPSLDAAVNFVTNESPLHVSVFGNIDAAKREPLRAAFEAPCERTVTTPVCASTRRTWW